MTAVPAARFARLREELGDGFIGVEIDSSEGNPGDTRRQPIPVLTEDYSDADGSPPGPPSIRFWTSSATDSAWVVPLNTMRTSLGRFGAIAIALICVQLDYFALALAPPNMAEDPHTTRRICSGPSAPT